MRYLRILSRVALAVLILCQMQGNAHAEECTNAFFCKPSPIRLLEPLSENGPTELAPEPGIDIFFTYFNYAWPWVIGSATGIGILQALFGGIQIMLSGGKDGDVFGKEAGKTRLMWALAGLLMIGLSGLILETLNPLFYEQA